MIIQSVFFNFFRQPEKQKLLVCFIAIIESILFIAIHMYNNAIIATLFGQEVTDIPSDLFIPPDALTVVLQHFEGPLDLLLYLIRKQNIDILDIPVAKITEQYLSYITEMEHSQIDLAAEYLLMASVLIEIKSRCLLPKPPAVENEEEDPRAELARRLIEYEQMKNAALKLNELPQAGRDFLQHHPRDDLHLHAPRRAQGGRRIFPLLPCEDGRTAIRLGTRIHHGDGRADGAPRLRAWP